jgi:predicted DCC family thiol-disulfide oxidoreductase YuxK
MASDTKFPLRIFYDGACMICSEEMDHYRKMDRKGVLIPIDISAADFDPAATGVSRDQLMAKLHAIDAEGKVYTGVDAFQAIWLAFPESLLLGVVSAFIGLPLINPLSKAVYWGFARLRHFLPRWGERCSNGHCRVGR